VEDVLIWGLSGILRPGWRQGGVFRGSQLFELFLRLPVAKRKTAREVVLALAQADAFLSHSGSGQGEI
jgi:hypothetical protein